MILYVFHIIENHTMYANILCSYQNEIQIVLLQHILLCNTLLKKCYKLLILKIILFAKEQLMHFSYCVGIQASNFSMFYDLGSHYEITVWTRMDCFLCSAKCHKFCY
jgi:hypothetical protein